MLACSMLRYAHRIDFALACSASFQPSGVEEGKLTGHLTKRENCKYFVAVEEGLRVQ